MIVILALGVVRRVRPVVDRRCRPPRSMDYQSPLPVTPSDVSPDRPIRLSELDGKGVVQKRLRKARHTLIQRRNAVESSNGRRDSMPSRRSISSNPQYSSKCGKTL